MTYLYPIFLTCIILFLIFEIVTCFNQRLFNIIKGEKTLYLKQELEQCRYNKHCKIIYLNSCSKLKGCYITNTTTSLIFPYYICTNEYKKDYGILIFSKEYYIIKNKLKELNNK